MKKILLILLINLVGTGLTYSQCDPEGEDFKVSVTTDAPSSCGQNDGSARIDMYCGTDGDCYEPGSVVSEFNCNAADYSNHYSGGGDYYVNAGETVLVSGPFDGTVVIQPGGTLVTCGEVMLNNQINLVSGSKMVNLGDLTLHAYNLNDETALLQNFGEINLMYQSSSSWGSIQVDAGTVQNYGNITMPIDYSLNDTTSVFENYGHLEVGTEPSIQELRQTNVRGRMENYGSINTALNTQIDPGGSVVNYCQMNSSKSMYLTESGLFENYGAIEVAREFYLRNQVIVDGGSSVIADKLVLENLIITNNEAACALLKGISELRVQIYEPFTEVLANGAMSICTEGESHELQWLTLGSGATLGCQCTPVDPVSGGIIYATNCLATWPDGLVTNERNDLSSGDYLVSISCGGTFIRQELVTIPPSTEGVPEVVVLPVAASTTCDGRIELSSISGGTPPFAYTLNNLAGNFPFESLCAGNYHLEVSDAVECKVAIPVTIPGDVDCSGFGVSASPLSTPSSGSCNGVYLAQASGNTGPVAFRWSDQEGTVIGNEAQQTGLCIGHWYYVEAVDRTTQCMVTTSVYSGHDTTDCGHAIRIRTRDESCAGSGDGKIAFHTSQGLRSGSSGNCFEGVIPNETCVSCDAYLSGNQNGNALSDGRRYCVQAGQSISGNLNIQNATVVVCGDATNLYVTLGNESTLFLNGNSQLQSLNGSGTNARLINTGTLTLSQMNASLTNFENYGLFNCDYYYRFNETGEHINYGTMDIGQSAVIQGVFQNYGTINVTDWDQNNTTGQLHNYCAVNVTGNVYQSSLIRNEGTFNSIGSWHLNADGTYESVGGSMTNGAHLHFYGIMRGLEGASVIKFGGSINAHGTMEGPLQVCGFSNTSNMTVGPDVEFYNNCEEIQLGCDLLWSLSSGGEVISTDTLLTNLRAGTYYYTLSCGSCTDTGHVVIGSPPLLTLRIDEAKPASCANRCDGELETQVSGGTSPYYYEWDDNRTDASYEQGCAGLHALRVTDEHGCQVGYDATITVGDGPCLCDPPTISLTLDFSNASAANASDGSASVLASGGVGDYEYDWYSEAATGLLPDSALITGLLPGVYQVTVTDAFQCSKSGQVTVGADGGVCQLTADFDQLSEPSCANKADGVLEVDVQNATSDLEVDWYYNGLLLPDVNGLSYHQAATGYYRVVIREKGGLHCVQQLEASLSYADDCDSNCGGIKVGIDEVSDASCADVPDGALEWSVSFGNSPFDYFWYGNTSGHELNHPFYRYRAEKLLNGDYLIMARDSGNCHAGVNTRVEAGDDGCNDCNFEALISVVPPSSATVCNARARLHILDDGDNYEYEIYWSNGSVDTMLIAQQCAGDYWVLLRQYLNGAFVCETKKYFKFPKGPGGEIPCDQATPLELDLKIHNLVVGVPGIATHWLDLQVTGGVGDYRYVWTNGARTQDISIQLAGTYGVRVYSGECSNYADTSITIPGINNDCPEPLTGYADRVEWFVKQPDCSDSPGGALGDINLVVHHFGSGGPYAFLWDQMGAITEDVSSLAPGDYYVTIMDITGHSQKFGPINIIDAGCPGGACEGTTHVVDSLCDYYAENGAIQLMINEGVGPFRYEWSRDGAFFSQERHLSNVGRGSYVARVTDASNCVFTTPALEMPVATACDTSCLCRLLVSSSPSGCPEEAPSGKVYAHLDGGVRPVYTWDIPATGTVVSGLESGIYKVAVADGERLACNTSEFVTVGLSNPDGVCCADFNPSIMPLPATGCGLSGTVLYVTQPGTRYVWNTGERTRSITINTPGVYQVEVWNEEGCYHDLSFTVTDPDDDYDGSNRIYASDEYLCYGSSVTLYAPVIPGASYEWYPNGETTPSIQVSEEGYYWVLITWGNCSMKTTVYTVHGAPLPDDVGINSFVSTLCPDDGVSYPLISTEGIGNAWYFNGELVDTNQVIQASQPGVYRLEVTYPGCEAIIKELTIDKHCDEDSNCNPLAMIISGFDPDDLVSCKDYLINEAEYEAQTLYREYLEGVRTDFKKRYVEHCLDVTERFEMENTGGETTHHYTLYYYDQSGNLVRTVPPEGVHPLEPELLANVQADRVAGRRQILPKHDYATTYTYNSLNQQYAEAIPDHDLLEYHSVSEGKGLEGGLAITGVQMGHVGRAVLFGNDEQGEGIMYYTEDNGANWQEVSGLGAEDLYVAYISDDGTYYTAGDGGTVARNGSEDQGWVLRNIGAQERVEYLRFFPSDADSGIAITAERSVYLTADKGDSWQQVPKLNFDEVVGVIRAYEFISADLGYAVSNVGTEGKIYRTVDGGQSWEELFINTLERQPLALTADRNGIYIAGEKGLLLSVKRNELGYLPINYNNIDFVEILAGSQGLFIKLESGNWDKLDPVTGTSSRLEILDRVAITLQTREAMALKYTSVIGKREVIQYEEADYEPRFLELLNPEISFATPESYIYWTDNALYLKAPETPDMELTLANNEPWSEISWAHVGYEAGRKASNVVVITADGWYYGEDMGSSANWITVTPTDWDETVEQVSFTDRLGGFVRTASQCYFTTDGGYSWELFATIGVDDPVFVDMAFSVSGVIGIDADGVMYSWNSVAGWQEMLINLPAQSINDLELMRGARITDHLLYTCGTGGQILSIDYQEDALIVVDQASQTTEDLTHIVEGVNTVEGQPFAFSSSGQWVFYDGEEWKRQLLGSGFTLRDICFGTGLSGMAIDEQGRLYSKDHDAITWEDLEVFDMNAVDNYSALITTSSIAVGDNGKLVQRAFGNDNVVDLFKIPVIEDMVLLSSGTGYAVGSQGGILKTTDGGRNWRPQGAPSSAQLRGVAFYDDDHGLAVGDDGVLYTNDGGVSWHQGPTGVTLNAVAYRSAEEAVVVGPVNNGVVAIYYLNTQNYTLNRLNGTDFANGILPLAQVMNDVQFVNENVGYAVGANNSIYQYDARDGSAIWNYLPTVSDVSDGDWASLDFYEEEAGYLAGTVDGEGKVLKVALVNGTTWSSIDLSEHPSSDIEGSILDGDALAVSFDNPTKGVVVTDGSVYTIDERSDRFTSLMWYDELGRVVMSQNPRQQSKRPPAYSYTFYDFLGRVIEVGEVAQSADPTAELKQQNTAFNVEESYVREFVGTGERREVVRTYYDVVHPYLDDIEMHYKAQGAQVDFNDVTLRNRVSSIVYTEIPSIIDGSVSDPLTTGDFDYACHYSYDIHGNVHTQIVDNPALERFGQRYKRTDYEYDLISGNVNMLAYQPGEKDQFYHRYAYDADNRLQKVETSANGYVWEQEATYEYYRHGPLMRKVIGDLQVQGCDYAYTLQGWLKAMNSNNLQTDLDIGQDGVANDIPADEFGCELGYYQGDYLAIGTQRYTGSQLGGAINSDDHTDDLYNGSISKRVTAIAHLMGSNNAPAVFGYRYDQLNRLRSGQWYDSQGSDLSNLTAGADKYHVALNYDANGNIQTLKRHAGQGELMDDFEYHYDDQGARKRNRLLQVEDNQIIVSENDWGDIQPGQDSDNYGYDGTGNLIKDTQEEIESIEWTTDHKIRRITRTEGSTKPDLEFLYDGMRNRIMKLEIAQSPVAVPNITWYVRDANGKLLALYEQAGHALFLRERCLYGQDHLGLNTRELNLTDGSLPTGEEQPIQLDYGTKQYELKDHLGNVNVVVSGKRLPVYDNGLAVGFSAEVLSVNDYYPFGMSMPGRTYNSGKYRYGFNGMEKDDEVKGEGNSYDFGLRHYDPRLGRMKSIDPRTPEYPWQSPYVYHRNNPINFIDYLGGGDDDALLFFELSHKLLIKFPKLSFPVYHFKVEIEPLNITLYEAKFRLEYNLDENKLSTDKSEFYTYYNKKVASTAVNVSYGPATVGHERETTNEPGKKTELKSTTSVGVSAESKRIGLSGGVAYKHEKISGEPKGRNILAASAKKDNALGPIASEAGASIGISAVEIDEEAQKPSPETGARGTSGFDENEGKEDEERNGGGGGTSSY